jgi:hypothetical protein
LDLISKLGNERPACAGARRSVRRYDEATKRRKPRYVLLKMGQYRIRHLQAMGYGHSGGGFSEPRRFLTCIGARHWRGPLVGLGSLVSRGTPTSCEDGRPSYGSRASEMLAAKTQSSVVQVQDFRFWCPPPRAMPRDPAFKQGTVRSVPSSIADDPFGEADGVQAALQRWARLSLLAGPSLPYDGYRLRRPCGSWRSGTYVSRALLCLAGPSF